MELKISNLLAQIFLYKNAYGKKAVFEFCVRQTGKTRPRLTRMHHKMVTWVTYPDYVYHLIVMKMEILQMTKEEYDATIEQAVTIALAKYEERRNAVLITREETAARLHVNISTLWRWEKSGFLRPKSRIGGRLYYELETVLRIERGEKEV